MSGRFHVLLDIDSLWIGIRCEIPENSEPVVKTNKNDDPGILDGEHVEILLETDVHSFYQIAFNPAGALISRDLSKGDESAGDNWKSQAEVATHVGDNFWSAEIRIPIARDHGDPIHQVSYSQPPGSDFPWHFNIVRTRLQDAGRHQSFFVEPESGDAYNPVNFGRLTR